MKKLFALLAALVSFGAHAIGTVTLAGSPFAVVTSGVASAFATSVVDRCITVAAVLYNSATPCGANLTFSGTALTVTGTVAHTAGLLTGTKLTVSGTAPTIASGFGTSPSVITSNGTAAFTINVGTGGTASSGVVTMPTATTGWACKVLPNTAPQAAAVMYSVPTSITSITITNYTLTTGAALAWSTGQVIVVMCTGY